MVFLGHDRRKIVRFDVTQHPTSGWLSRQVTEAFPWDTARATCCAIAMRLMARLSVTGSRRWESPTSSQHQDRSGRTPMSSAWSARSAGSVWINSDLQRAPFARCPVLVRRLLSPLSDASFTRQGLSRAPTDTDLQDRKSHRHPASRWPTPSLPAPRGLTPLSDRSLLVAGGRYVVLCESPYWRRFDLDHASTGCGSDRSAPRSIAAR
jgi:hypothetical protein